MKCTLLDWHIPSCSAYDSDILIFNFSTKNKYEKYSGVRGPYSSGGTVEFKLSAKRRDETGVYYVYVWFLSVS